MCVISTCREDWDNVKISSEAGIFAGDGQQPTILKDDPVYSTVSDTQQQQIFTMSADQAYGTVDKDNQQNVLQDNPTHFSLKRSVAVRNKCGQGHTLVLCVYPHNMLILQIIFAFLAVTGSVY